ncbi:MAG: energy transducer TonB [Pseudomonadota bacterium]
MSTLSYNHKTIIAQMPLKRLFPIPMGAAMTAVLFLIMQSVVAEKDIEIPQTFILGPVELVLIPPEEEVPPIPPIPEPIKPEAEPPTIREPVIGRGTEIVGSTKWPVPGSAEHVFDLAPADGELTPIVTVAPDYPRRQLAQGIEGWVLIEFAVDKLGRVVDPFVVDAQPGSAFNQAALKAVLRYKYRPKIVHGKAVEVAGVRQRIHFQLN